MENSESSNTIYAQVFSMVTACLSLVAVLPILTKSVKFYLGGSIKFH